jgi:hypothetical protein
VRCDGGCGNVFNVEDLRQVDLEDDDGNIVSRVAVCSECDEMALVEVDELLARFEHHVRRG